jgi:hypothetical protein
VLLAAAEQGGLDGLTGGIEVAIAFFASGLRLQACMQQAILLTSRSLDSFQASHLIHCSAGDTMCESIMSTVKASSMMSRVRSCPAANWAVKQ